jgi:hypothetical protein
MPPDAGDVRLVVACGPLARPLVARVIGIAAARADLPFDRVDDVAERAQPELSSEQLELDVRPSPGGIVLRVGTLRCDGAQRIVDGTPGAGSGTAIARLATSWGTEPEGEGERLVVEIASRGTR